VWHDIEKERKMGLNKIIKTPTQSHSVSQFSSGDDAAIPTGILSYKPEQKNL
jgi:hypothetical protein